MTFPGPFCLPVQLHGGPDAAGIPVFDFSTNSNACGPCPMALAAVQQADATRYPDPAYTALRAQLAGEPIQVIEALPPVVDTQMTADRDMSKMPPQECARQIIAALEQGRDEANVGMVKLLRAVYSLSPALARRVMRSF